MNPRTPAGPPTVREKLAWCFFDFANSSYTTVITTVVYARYFVTVVVPEDSWWGIHEDTWWAASGVLSQALVIITAPLLGAMADQGAKKKAYLFRSYLVCVAATALLTLTGAGCVLPAFVLVVVANTAFYVGENLIAGFLPELAAPEEMGRLSGYGWTLGYFGGLLSLFLALPLAKAGLAAETCLVTAAFFGLAGLPTFALLRERAVPVPHAQRQSAGHAAFGAMLRTLRAWRRFPDLFVFLLAILLFQGGVAVIISFSAIYAETEIGMSGAEVIYLFIGLQLAAAVGAWSFGILQDRIGSRPCLVLALVVWIAAVVLAWTAARGPVFVAAAALAGVAMGSSQSASRALVGLFCPPGREAEWFGLWGLATKGAALLGLGFYGLMMLGGDRRSAILSTLVLFVGGLILVLRVDVARGRTAARTVPDAAPRSSLPGTG